MKEIKKISVDLKLVPAILHSGLFFTRQRDFFTYRKEQKTLASRLFYFCINLIVTLALGPE